jgi:organic hydroperoxide reductase OsmC/OhrA
LGPISVSVTLDLDGAPLLATGAVIKVECEMADGSDPRAIIAEAERISTVANSLKAGLPVRVTTP